MIITNYSQEDFSQIYSILSTENNSLWKKEDLEHSLKLDNVVCFVAKNSDIILGFVLLETTSFDFDILEIAVREDMREKGIGTMLIQQVFQYAKSTNKEKATLEVAFDNKPAISLYEKFGFLKISERKKYYQNGKTAFIYQKKF